MVESSSLFLTVTKINKCNRGVDNYALGLAFIPDCYKTHKKCVDAVNTFLFAIQFVAECYMTD